jgi:FAD/FMN-containing dehydrogenase/Fe-S oxidoreductase
MATEPISTDTIQLLEDRQLLQTLEHELRAAVQGEVSFDLASRALYATDASPYEIMPVGVVLPRTNDDVRATLQIATRHNVPVLARGGGTSLAGQAVGAAIIIDTSRYLTEILEFNKTEQWVRVQPGVIRDQLNNFLAPHNLQFTPDVSTTNRANIGGMVANNSAGTRSIKYGRTVDQVISMRVLLSDGSITELRELSSSELNERLQRTDRLGDIHRTLHDIITQHETEIIKRYPKVMRRVGGYNLDEFTGGKPFNLAKLISGSEGTLAIILDVTLQLHPLPAKRVQALLHFHSMQAALQAVPFINRHGPSAVELLDDVVFNLGRENPELSPLLSWLDGEPAVVLITEFDGATGEEVLLALARLQADSELQQLCYSTVEAIDPQLQADVLEFRRAGLGIYSTIKGAEQPTAFIEDAAIPPENLQYYVPEVLALCRRHNTRVVVYGHASVGVLHLRPLIDLKTAEGLRKFQMISDETFQLVMKYGGAWSGEHGDGLIRSGQNRELFGDTIYAAFQQVKRAFDPQNILNPGKIIDSAPMTENLRYGTPYPRDSQQTFFDFSSQDGMLGAAEACVGVGACRKVDVGSMCPSYMATRDEQHSTRGRANTLRLALNGRLPGGLASKEVKDALDLCLECKACKAECPSQVDMAKMKYEFLQHYHDEHGVSLNTLALGSAARIAPLAQKLAPMANLMLPLAPVRWIAEKTAGIDRRRVMPAYTRQDFASWFKKHQRNNLAPAANGSERASGNNTDQANQAGSRVALFADTWTMYNEPEIGRAAVRVLEHLGYQVELVPYGCCGRPLISKGLLRQAKKQAQQSVDTLNKYVQQGIPVIGLEPSCVTAFTDDYPDLIPGETTSAVAGHVKLLEQFLAKEWTQGRIKPDQAFTKGSEALLVQSHCQQKAVLGTTATSAVLGWVSSDVQQPDLGCCGMAGSFGYGHYDVSMTVGESRVFPAIRQHTGKTVACGFSCRHQIKDGTKTHAKHVSEILAEHLLPSPGTAGD